MKDCFNACGFCVLTAALILTIVFTGCGGSGNQSSTIDEVQYETTAEAININTASAADLEKLPFVGAQLAEQIIEHRTKHGRFRKPEHLMLIDGISDKRFRLIRHLIRVD